MFIYIKRKRIRSLEVESVAKKNVYMLQQIENRLKVKVKNSIVSLCSDYVTMKKQCIYAVNK